MQDQLEQSHPFRNVEKICEKLEWTEDLLEVQMENEMTKKE
jgi:hypothetical protein